MADIDINPEPPKPITVSLLGKDYTVRPIKTSLGLSLAQGLKGAGNDPAKLKSNIGKLLVMMFGPTDAKAVEKRLEAADDDLDYPHIMQLLNALIERSTGNPTTSASD